MKRLSADGVTDKSFRASWAIGRRPARLRPYLILLLVLTVVGLLLAPYDVAFAKHVRQAGVPGDLRRVLDWSEVFAHGMGVALIALTAFWLDPPRRRYWPRILLTAYSAGLFGNVIKVVVIRVRPYAFLESTDLPETTAATFQGWFPLFALDWGEALSHRIQSFPSGHTATAVAFACALSLVYPRGKWLFGILAIAAGLQRLAASAHYPTDVLAGAAIGVVAAVVWWVKPESAIGGVLRSSQEHCPTSPDN